ncbi:MAG: hypothetical protein GXY33_04700 [Phycisphaerae bacterium]|nr:hypothetical protein [Phycisphaerae bacterium]
MIEQGSKCKSGRRQASRRSAAALWTVVTFSVMAGFAAMAIDLGHLFLVKDQMQTAADAAALAGISGLTTPVPITDPGGHELLAYEARARAARYAGKNFAENLPLKLSYSDIAVGFISDPDNLDQDLVPGLTPYNAVKVTVAKGRQAANTPVSLFFAAIWGKNTADMSVTATAYLDMRMKGYRPVQNKRGPTIPVSVYKDRFEHDVVFALGGDNFGYDPQTGQITQGADGIPELVIFPERQNDYTDGNAGAGTFGILNINVGNNGASTVADQIRNGVTGEDLTSEFGTDTIVFYTEAGFEDEHAVEGVPIVSVGYDIEGNPGLMASLKDDFEYRLGDVIGFFVHDAIDETGSNTLFNITDMQFGRLVHVNLTGAPQNKVIVVQPTVYVGEEIVTGDEIPLHYTGGRIRLIR